MSFFQNLPQAFVSIPWQSMVPFGQCECRKPSQTGNGGHRETESLHLHMLIHPLASHQVSYEDVNRLKKFGVLEKARIPHFMQDLERYMKQLDHIVTTNQMDEQELEELLPE